MFKEFRDFIARGSVIDLAVGIIIGSAFTTVVNSLVNDIIMPPIGLLIGGVDFTQLYINLSGGDYESLAAAQEAGAATINIGLFINNIITFLIIALAVFLLVRGINRLRALREQEEPPAAPPAPTVQEKMLAVLTSIEKKLDQ
ncbi:MAG: large-conductance mechanosensitive channel protein MscL [Chloroflexi bacterium]|nr:large-conductance mechanosensitive channel protein MscL [Chloroflexota bacterium]